LNRFVFVPLYVGLVVFFSGLPAPKGYFIGLLVFLSDDKATFLQSPIMLLFALGPFLLIAVAFLRGRVINKKWLPLLPTTAFLVAFGPLITKLILSNFLALEQIQRFAVEGGLLRLGAPISMVILHLACLILGLSGPGVGAERGYKTKAQSTEA